MNSEATKEANFAAGSETVTTETDSVPTLKLKLKKEERKKVQWTTETVDNEHLGKKKSKCCCVFVKKRAFGESESDESEDDCDHCSGHTPSDPKN